MLQNWSQVDNRLGLKWVNRVILKILLSKWLAWLGQLRVLRLIYYLSVSLGSQYQRVIDNDDILRRCRHWYKNMINIGKH